MERREADQAGAVDRETERAVLRHFRASKGLYRSLARHITKVVIRADGGKSSQSAIFSVQWRMKGDARLLEKIRSRGLNLLNYQSNIRDLLGLRIICLTSMDVRRVVELLDRLFDQELLGLLGGPQYRRSFLVPSEADIPVRGEREIERSGYSAIQYTVSSGKEFAHREARQLRAELQVVTILEYAWAEIDHRFRYKMARSGMAVAPHVTAGFCTLGGYLQVAATQIDQLAADAAQYQDPIGGRQLDELKRVTEGIFTAAFPLASVHRVADALLRHSPHEAPAVTFQAVTGGGEPEAFFDVFAECLGRLPFSRPEAVGKDLVELTEYCIARADGESGETLRRATAERLRRHKI